MTFEELLLQLKNKIAHNPYEKDEEESLDSTDGLGSGSRGPGGDGIDMNPTPKLKPKRLEKAPIPSNSNNPGKSLNQVEWLDKLSFTNTLLKIKNNLTGSVLDYPKPGLDPQVWQADGTMHTAIKQEILKKLSDFFQSKGVKKEVKKFVKYVNIIGSLTSYQYNSKSDLDVHVGIHLNAFKDALSKTTFWVNDDELADLLNKTWKDELNEIEPKVVQGTSHPVEYFFEIEGYYNTNRSDGVYSLLKNKWKKEPRTVDYDFDLAEYYPKIVEEANDFLKDIDSGLGEVKRDIGDIALLKETLERFPKEKRKLFKKKIHEKIDQINYNISVIVETGQEIIDKRKQDYKPEAISNILFKYLQRYGYVWLIKQLEDVLENDVTEEVNIEDLNDVMELEQILDDFECREDDTVKLAQYDMCTLQTSEIPEDITAQIRKIQESIPKEKLNSDADEPGWVEGGVQELLHATILYGINIKDLDKAKEIYKKYPNIDIEAKELGFFDIDEPERDAYYTAAYIACDAPELKKLHEELRENIENQHDKDFHAHITVAYLNYGERIDGDIEPMKWELDNAEMIDTKGQPHKLAFTKISKSMVGWIMPDDKAVLGDDNHWQTIRKYFPEMMFSNYDEAFDEGWIRVSDSAKYDYPGDSMLGFECNRTFDADVLARIAKFIDGNPEASGRKYIRLSKTEEGVSRKELMFPMRDYEKFGILRAVSKAEKAKVSFGLKDLNEKSIFQSLFAHKFKTASNIENDFDKFLINATDKEVLTVLEALQDNRIEEATSIIKGE
jgi:2'-5' RNA ligase